MTQSNFDYININSDSDTDEEDNHFKDKFSVVSDLNTVECNICLSKYNTLFKCNKCIFQICPICFNSYYFIYNYKTCAICKS